VRRAALVAACLAAGCAAQRKPAWESPSQPFGTVSDAVIDALEADGDRAWGERRARERVDAAVQAWRAALHYRPASASLMVRVSLGLRRRARAQTGETARATLDQAVAFAERALAARNDELRRRAVAAERPAAIFAAAEAADLPALIAYADALVDWSELGGRATLLAAADALQAAAERAAALDRRFQYGAPDRLLGTIYAVRGDRRRAPPCFEAAAASAPGYLPNKLAWAARLRDRRLLEEVAAADPGALPAAAPENEDAQREARRLLRGG
jgi:hypothetical protein